MIHTDYTLPMTLILIQGVLGALDTLYYHEYRYRLSAYAVESRDELRLHGARDLIYGLLFITLSQVAWGGLWSWALLALIFAEVIITLADFVIERRVRSAWGGLATGELVMHALMAILYGAFITTLAPHWWAWSALESGFHLHAQPLSPWMVSALSLMGCGVTIAGLRDVLLSTLWLPKAWRRRLAFPWRRDTHPPSIVRL